MPVECTNGTLGVYVLNEMVNVQSSKGGNISMQHNGIASTYSKTSLIISYHTIVSISRKPGAIRA